MAWLITTQAFSPSARQQSYNAVKSAAQMAGGGLRQIESSPRGAPLTTFTHMVHCNVEGRGRALGQLAPSLPGWLAGIPRGVGGEVAGGEVG